MQSNEHEKNKEGDKEYKRNKANKEKQYEQQHEDNKETMTRTTEREISPDKARARRTNTDNNEDMADDNDRIRYHHFLSTRHPTKNYSKQCHATKSEP